MPLRSTRDGPENVEHTPLICSSGVSEAKGHRDVAVHAERRDKRSRELIGLFHLNLVVTRVGVKKGQKFTSRSRINNLINTWQRKGTFEHTLFKLV